MLVSGRERVRDAVLDVLVEQLERDALERVRHGGDLREDVDAVALVLDHPLDPADLALDAVQPLDERVLVRDVAVLVGRHAAVTLLEASEPQSVADDEQRSSTPSPLPRRSG